MTKMACLWFCLSILIGAVLFQTTQRVNDGRQKLAALTHSLQEEEETLRVLQAEWSYLNQPDRLEKLSREYLKLTPMKGQQFSRTDSIALRPAPAAPQEDTTALLAAIEAPDTTEVLVQAAATTPRPPVCKPALRPAALTTTAPPQPRLVKTTTRQPVARTARQEQHRDFGDVIQSLGVAGQ